MKTENKMAISKESIIKNLQLRLAEKEDLINAIQSGKVDVLVTKNEQGKENIFQLKGAEVTYQMLIESMNEGAITLLEDGTILYCNKKFSELVNRPVDNIINTKIFLYIKKNRVKKLKYLIKKSKKEATKEVFILESKDNILRTVYFSCQIIKLNKVNAISIVVTDISELQQTEQRYSSLIENAGCGILVHDFDGNIIEINKQTEKILDCTKEQIINKNIRNFIPPSAHAYCDAQLHKLINKKSVGPNEGQFLRPNGDLVDIIFTVTKISFLNKELLLGIVNDVTERNRLRSQALLTDKLSTIGTLASGIVHEINNPMTWVLSNLGYIKDSLNKINITNQNELKIKSKIIEAIDESIQGGNKIKDITQSLKGFIHIDDVFTPFDVNSVAESAVKMAGPQFKDKIKIELDLSPHIPLILTNKNKLHQVILNLLVNSAQSMDESKKDNKIWVKSYNNDKYICIDVGDTGKGIPEKDLSKIFEPFFTTKAVGIGTGLGLSLCTEIMQNLGGAISVKSEVNKGSVFTICLPLQLIAANKNQAKINNNAKLKQKKILLINNEVYLSNIIKRILEANYAVTAVPNGRVALELLVDDMNKFDLIICNFDMPDINGLDIYRYVSQKNSSQRILFTIDDSFIETKSTIPKSTNIAYINKSFKQKIFIALIEQLLKISA